MLRWQTQKRDRASAREKNSMWRLSDLKHTYFWCWLLGHKIRAVGHWMDLECARCGAWDPDRFEK
jgi:hypothetical protein